jgi:hypothetical protein
MVGEVARGLSLFGVYHFPSVCRLSVCLSRNPWGVEVAAREVAGAVDVEDAVPRRRKTWPHPFKACR